MGYSTKQRIYEINRLSVSVDDGTISGKAVGIYAQNRPSDHLDGLEGIKNKQSISECGILD